jgi:hypothetical protein
VTEQSDKNYMSNKKEMNLVEIKNEINTKIADAETFAVLVSTTFKGLEAPLAKRALLEGMMRGFKFEDFLTKNVYAVPFGTSAYSLVTSIDYSRKIGMRSGIVGVDEPVYTLDDDSKPVTCSVTVKKRFEDGYIGEFTALVYFKEYTTGKNLWSSKPMTMIDKVAEMHALRKACPEELSQAYAEEEVTRVEPPESADAEEEVPEQIVSDWRDQLEQAGDLESFQTVWANVPPKIKPLVKELAATLKKKYEDIKV